MTQNGADVALRDAFPSVAGCRGCCSGLRLDCSKLSWSLTTATSSHLHLFIELHLEASPADGSWSLFVGFVKRIEIMQPLVKLAFRGRWRIWVIVGVPMGTPNPKSSGYAMQSRQLRTREHAQCFISPFLYKAVAISDAKNSGVGLETFFRSYVPANGPYKPMAFILWWRRNGYWCWRGGGGGGSLTEEQVYSLRRLFPQSNNATNRFQRCDKLVNITCNDTTKWELPGDWPIVLNTWSP